jgi:hypothetical protein
MSNLLVRCSFELRALALAGNNPGLQAKSNQSRWLDLSIPSAFLDGSEQLLPAGKRAHNQTRDENNHTSKTRAFGATDMDDSLPIVGSRCECCSS